MKKLKSFLATIAIFAATTFSAIALSGVEQKIPDQSGQFVYYKDSTFERESYIGIIYFDDSTYGLRYYAPVDEKNGKPETKMQVYLTIDSVLLAEQGKVEFTGERVEPLPKSQEETDIINYLHDFVYEMFPRRIMFGDVSKVEKMTDTYEQFGGVVEIEYDPIVPVLNLKQIITSDRKIALEAITGGKLISSDDGSFTDFTGIPSKDNSKTSEKIKKGKSSKITIENEDLKNQEFEIDSKWTQKSPASWMLESKAAVSSVVLPISENQKDKLLRTLILGRAKSYPDWTKQKLTEKDGRIQLNQIFYDAESNTFKSDFKIIESLGENAKGIFTLTTDSSLYIKNKSYFEKILSSYKSK